MLIRILYVFLLITAITSQGIAQSQETYVRASIDLKVKDFLELAKAGIETDHGLLVPGRYFISDFSVSELELIKKIGFTCDVLIENVSEYYASPNRNDDESLQLNRRLNRCDGLPAAEYNYETPVNYRPGTMNGYFTYSEIMQHLDDMAEKYPDLISRRASIEGFPTHNGNLLQYIKLSDNVDKDEEEPEVLYTALHHAREPNSVSQMIFFLWYLLENYGKNDIVTKIVNETELYFLPCINPDGYLQNQLTNPNGGGLWRKNMWKDSLGNLKGVDLNRNYGFFWGFDNVGSSVNPNSQTYRGAKPFSEPETQAVRAFCLDREFSMALNYHTFGNYLIHPWGYNDLPTDENTLFKGMGSVINLENQFLMGTGSETVGYTVNGVSDDWMYGDNGEKNKIYSYTPEVGPSFWPAPGSIDRLNKSCVWMNMATALLTLSFYEASDDRDDGILSPQNARITVSVSRFGLKPGSCTLRLKPKVDGVRVLNGEIQATLELGSSQQIVFELDIDQGMITDPELYFSL
jgi:carboxypeptidase T